MKAASTVKHYSGYILLSKCPENITLGKTGISLIAIRPPASGILLKSMGDVMRWITFDQETYSALRAVRPRENAFEFPSRTALQYALESENTVVAILPAAQSEAAIATFRKRGALPDRGVAEPARAPAGDFRAGGILGLRDEPAFLREEEEPEKRNWWRRFWDY